MGDLDADPVMIGFDFISLYPNIEAVAAAQDGYDAMIIELEFTNINYITTERISGSVQSELS